MLFRPIESLAATEPMGAFAARSETDVLSALFGDTQAIPSGVVKIKAPIQAMQGKAIAFKVWCDLDGVKVEALKQQSAEGPVPSRAGKLINTVTCYAPENNAS